jgi:hypothetical protein
MNDLMVPVELAPDSDRDVAHFRFNGEGRLILDTERGQIVIDILPDSVNAFTQTPSGRKDFCLL